MKLSKKLEKFSHLQLLFGFSLFYVFCLYDNVSGVLYPVFLTRMLMMYQCLMEQAGRSIKKDSKLYMLAILLLFTGSGLLLPHSPAFGQLREHREKMGQCHHCQLP